MKRRLEQHISEKVWRIDVSRHLHQYVQNQNQSQKDTLDLKHSREDIKLFSLTRVSYLEEDIFTYFYPFCLLNCSAATLWTFRQAGVLPCAVALCATLEYVYFLFAFPVETYWFHRRALSTSKPYAAFLRQQYVERFPHSWKADCYRRLDERERRKYARKSKTLMSLNNNL